MKEIILTGEKYNGCCSLKKRVKKGVLYNKNNEILIYERRDKSLALPSVETDDENIFYKELSKLVNVPFSKENLNSFLTLINIEPRFEHKNTKLKKYYMKMIKDYYSCFIDFNTPSKIHPMEYMNEVLYPKFMSIEKVIESTPHDHNANALCEFQKIKKR